MFGVLCVLAVLGVALKMGEVFNQSNTTPQTSPTAVPAPVVAAPPEPVTTYSAEYLKAHPQAGNDTPVMPPLDWREQEKATWRGKQVPQLSASKFRRTTAQRAVADFVNAWKAKDYKHMTAATQVSWRKGQVKPAQTLKNWFDLTTVHGARIVSTETSGEDGRRVTVDVYCNMPQSDPTIEQHEFMVIRESEDGSPSPSGKWGVNPSSVLRTMSTRPMK